MFHTIEFNDELLLDVEISPKHRLEQLYVQSGTRASAQIRPYVVETDDGPIEVADLFVAEGTVGRMVPYASFCFVE